MGSEERIDAAGARGGSALAAAVAATVVVALSTAPLGAQDVGHERFVGDWGGTLVVGPQQLPIVFHLTVSDGGLEATMDSPAQNAFAIPMDEVRVSGDSISVTLAAAQARYDGVLTESGALAGTWTQGGGRFELEMERVEGGGDGAGEAPAGPTVPDPSTRPQTPRPPYPYASEDVVFEGAEALRLAGTLTTPRGDGPHPGVILVTGSGPQDRDETLMGHKPFAVLADHLTRAGIAVLRYDERGVGESEGDFGSATSYDFAADAEAALGYLAARADVDADRVGIVGHSEGGLVGPLVASQSDRPAFVVMLAGPGMTGRDVIEDQSRAMARAQGADEAAIATNLAISAELFDIAVAEPDPEAAADAMAQVLRAALAELDSATRAAAGIPQGGEEAFIAGQVNQVNTPWFRTFLAYDPLPALESLQVPVLAVNGELDLQVTHEANLAAIEAALERGGNPDYTVVALPGLNHLFQTAETGSVAEYATIDETMSPRVMDLVADWINERFGDGG